MKLGEKIKQLRKSKGISQEELASTLKINRNFLSRIETGKSEPTASMLKNIAKIFNVDLNSLLDVKSLPSDNSNKLKYITDNCKYLDEKDIDFIIRIISIMKEEYVKVQAALEAVRGTGYGVVVPELKEIEIASPEVIRQGNKFGVKIRSKSPSIHMIKTNIETEIAPIVGTEQQAKDLIEYIDESSQRGESIWETNIFGKSIEQLVEDGIRTKIAAISEESQVKLQDTMQKIVNDSKGGLVCIII